MKALFLSILLTTISAIAYCQNYTLPSILFDSMYYEVVRGRACDSLQAVQATLIQSQGKQLLNQDNALKLAVSLADTKEAEVQELRQAFTKLEDKSNLETKQLKKQRFKLVLIAIGEAVLIVLLL